MFGLGMPEILLILAIALIVIGPKKLPDLAKTMGKAMGEFKRAAQDLKSSMDEDESFSGPSVSLPGSRVDKASHQSPDDWEKLTPYEQDSVVEGSASKDDDVFPEKSEENSSRKPIE